MQRYSFEGDAADAEQSMNESSGAGRLEATHAMLSDPGLRSEAGKTEVPARCVGSS